MAAPLLRLGTRGSKLALVQAGLVRDALAAAVPALAAPDAIEIVAIKTTGDAIQDRPLSGGRRQGPVRQGDRGGAARAAGSMPRSTA